MGSGNPQVAKASWVRLGYFEQFKSSNTLLIDGNGEGLNQLAKEFRLLELGAVQSVAIHLLNYAKTFHGVQLLATRSETDLGIRISGGNQFLWQRTNEDWVDVASMIAGVAKHANCHNYLDKNRDNLVVMVSSGEYGEGWWGWNE